MSDVEDRLHLADPAAAMSYEHHDVDAMVSRIVTQYPRRRTSLLRSFQIKAAAGATLAAVLTVGGIAALNGAAPSFAVLAIGSSVNHTRSQVPTSTRFAGAMAIFARYQFSAGDTLSSNAASTPSYRLQIPGDASSEAQRLATEFGVNRAPVDAIGDGSDWTVGDGTGPSLNYQNFGGIPVWSYTWSSSGASSSSSTSSASVPAVSNAVIEADAQRYLQRLGYAYSVADPQFSSSTVATTDPTPTTSNQTSVSFAVLVDGISTDQSVSFTVDSNNHLVDASGPAFSVSSSTDYPLISPADGVAALNAQQHRAFASPGIEQSGGGAAPTTTVVTPAPTPTPTAPVTSSPGSAGSSSSNATTTTILTAPPLIDVTLSEASVSLQSYVLTDGSVWLLPVYVYTGNYMTTDGTDETGTWPLLAVQPAYVDVSASTTPIAY